MMEDESICPETIFLELIEAKRDNDIVLLLEGVDDINYYRPRISMFLQNRKMTHIDCHGKDNLLGVHKLITPSQINLKNKKVLYFVDHDYQKNIKYPKDVYVTPCYAIENFYFTDEAFKNILSGVYKLNPYNKKDIDDYNKAFQYLLSKRNLYISHMIAPSAFYSLQMNKRTATQKPILLKLKEYKDIENLTTLAELKDKVENGFNVTESEFEAEKKYLQTDPVKLIRGKYFEQTLSKDFNDLISWSNNPKTPQNCVFSKKRPIKNAIGKESIITNFSSHAETPECLCKYLKKYL